MKSSVKPQWVYRSVPIELGPNRFSRDSWVRERVYESISRASEGKLTLIQKKPKQKKPEPPRLTREDMPQAKGLYVRQAFVDHASGQGFSVLAVCSGERCGGRARVFTHLDWAKPTRATYACNLCANAQRQKARRQNFIDKRARA